VHRGEIWLPKWPVPRRTNRQTKRRYVLILSWDAHLRRDRATVAPLTSEIRGLDAEVPLDHNDGLDVCVVNLDIIVTLLKTHRESFVARLSDDRMREVDRAVHYALGIPVPCAIIPRIPSPNPF